MKDQHRGKIDLNIVAAVAAALLLLSLFLNWADASFNAERWMSLATVESAPELNAWQWLSYWDLVLSAIALITVVVNIARVVRSNQFSEMFAATINLVGGLACSAVNVALAIDPPRPDFGFAPVEGHAVPIFVSIDYGLVVSVAIAVSIAWCGIAQLLLRSSSGG